MKVEYSDGTKKHYYNGRPSSFSLKEEALDLAAPFIIPGIIAAGIVGVGETVNLAEHVGKHKAPIEQHPHHQYNHSSRLGSGTIKAKSGDFHVSQR